MDTGSATERVEEVLRFAGFAQPTDLHLCAQAGVEPAAIPELLAELEKQKRWVKIKGTSVRVVPAAVDELRDRLATRLERYHRQQPDTPGRHEDAVLGWLERLTERTLARPLLERFLKEGVFKRLGAFICLAQFAPELSPADEKHLAVLVGEIRKGRFQPGSLPSLASAQGIERKRIEKLATLAVALGELVKIDNDIYLHATCAEELRAKVAELVAEHGGATVSQIREALDSSRKYVVPIVEYLDRIGFTKRQGDQRVLAEETAHG